MRDFPMFTTENGVGSLVLKEIPYSGIAYVTLRDATSVESFIAECRDFCRAVGARRIYATGHTALCAYPFYTTIVQMSVSADVIPDTDAAIFPVTEKTLHRWREIYNDRMRDVENAAYMSERDAEEMLKRGDGYFVHRDGALIGIGIAADECIDCVISVIPGQGRNVVSALAHALISDRVILDVASTNTRAVRLYESMGFIKVKERSSWYQIF